MILPQRGNKVSRGFRIGLDNVTEPDALLDLGFKARTVEAPNTVASCDRYGSASMTRTRIPFLANERPRPAQNEVLPSPGCAEVTSITCFRSDGLGAWMAVWMRTRAVPNREC